MSKHTFPVTTASFPAEVLQSAQPVLLDFGADWCPPCKMLDPIVDDIARRYEGRLRVGKVDSDADPDLAMRYGVQGLPTLILFQDGKEVKRMVGFQPRERIEAQLAAYTQAQTP